MSLKDNFKKKKKFPRGGKKVAVFDLDGTVFRSSLLIELLEGLITEGIFPARARKIYEKERLNWLNREAPYEDYIRGVIETHRRFIRGKKAEEVWGVARKVLSLQEKRTYRFTRDLISMIKKSHYLLAISGSPRAMVGPFGRKWGFNKVYGRFFEVDKKGYLTGVVTYEELIEDKEKILKRAVKKENLTLKDSIGVGDTEDDISFLKLVKYPIAFNPNLRLYRYALGKKWPIVVERKNVIYKIGGRRLAREIEDMIKK